MLEMCIKLQYCPNLALGENPLKEKPTNLKTIPNLFFVFVRSILIYTYINLYLILFIFSELALLAT